VVEKGGVERFNMDWIFIDNGSWNMGLEEHAQTFAEINECGLLSDEDRKYLIKRGILKPASVKSDICCPDCGSPISKDVIQKISELIFESIYRDREKHTNLLPSKPSSVIEHDSIMFR
jgi:hypothetical protein